ncbi:MAG: N-acetyl sugar amidotransferase [Elusimicrobiota bacterium]|jgi:N-acetyl sugar amidotransferase
MKTALAAINGIERCSRCTSPVTWETLELDKEGVCNVCRNWEQKGGKVDWAKRERMFWKIARQAKALKRDYDCIVPFSGGKDSTFTLWKLVRHFKLKPLVVSFDHWFYRPLTLENRARTFRRLGVDVLTFTPNWKIVRKLMLESLIRKGDFCWHCHAGIYAYPMQIAVRHKIPLLIWGEGGGEYESYSKFMDLEETDSWFFHRRVILGLSAKDMAGFIGAPERYLSPYTYPSKQELDDAGVRSYPLGKFVPWNVQKQVAILKKELGWQEDEMETAYEGRTYEKIECMFEGSRDYIKFLKRNYSRMTHLTSLDIRHGRMSRKEAMRLVQRREGKRPRSLEFLLEFLGISDQEFHEIVARHLIPPARVVDPKSMKVERKLWDQDRWLRDRG